MKQTTMLRKLTYEVAGQVGALNPAEIEAINSEINLSSITEVYLTLPSITDAALLAIVDIVRATVQVFDLRLKSDHPSLLTSQGIIRAFSHCPQLSHLSLRLTTNQKLSKSYLYPVHSLLPTLPKLTTLRLAGSGNELASLAGLARIGHRLERLSLRGDIIIDPNILLSVARTTKAFPQLKSLELESEKGISEDEGRIRDDLVCGEFGARGIDLYLVNRS